MQTDDADPGTDSAPFSDEPAAPDPGLRWWTGRGHPNPDMKRMLAGPPGLNLPGTIEELRIRQTGPNSAYVIEIGFRPSENKPS
jgi:hypothetical protein